MDSSSGSSGGSSGSIDAGSSSSSGGSGGSSGSSGGVSSGPDAGDYDLCGVGIQGISGSNVVAMFPDIVGGGMASHCSSGSCTFVVSDVPMTGLTETLTVQIPNPPPAAGQSYTLQAGCSGSAESYLWFSQADSKGTRTWQGSGTLEITGITAGSGGMPNTVNLKATGLSMSALTGTCATGNTATGTFTADFSCWAIPAYF
jgi:hypothetical protein